MTESTGTGTAAGTRRRKKMPGGLVLRALLLLGVVAVGYLVLAPVLEIGGVKAPRVQRAEPVRVAQGWDEVATRRFHRESQGTRILPIDWFLALEQPVFTPLAVGMFASRDYLGRFGFLYEDDAPPRDGPDLPVGFAIEKGMVAKYAIPPVETPTDIVGLTCAACHTGRLDVRLDDGKVMGVFIEGGSAMINLKMFQEATENAVGLTKIIPERFRRFADRVLEAEKGRGVIHPDESARTEELRKELDSYYTVGLSSRNYIAEHKLDGTEAGFSRTDALGLIGNRVFGVVTPENQIVTDAPVNFPHLWDTPWFDWVQYNASIRTPLDRNIGESLGVGAVINLTRPEYGLYSSSVNIEGLHWIEDSLGGQNPFEGLQPPKWEDMVLRAFGKPAPERSAYALEPERVAAGKVLYKKHCERCHMPPREELIDAYRRGSSAQFTEPDPGSGKRFLKVKVVDLNTIGTDPNQALNFYRRVAVSPEPALLTRAKGWTPSSGPASYPYWSDWVKENSPGEGQSATISAVQGLFQITGFIRRKNFEERLGLLAPPGMTDPKDREAFNKAKAGLRQQYDRFRYVPGPLDVGDEAAIVRGEWIDWVIVANPGYKSRPLDGIWATPPYFHNSSVPNLYEVLLPAARRSSTFALGSTRFDPERVGYETDMFPGAFAMDTALPGNHNTGHEFRNLTLEELEDQPWDGQSSRDERWAHVLGIDVAEYRAMSEDRRWEKVRDVSRNVLSRPHLLGIKGVLGPEFSEDERWQLVEYLKSL